MARPHASITGRTKPRHRQSHRLQDALASLHRRGLRMNKLASPDTFNFLSAPEIRFLEAAVERLIPTDELGPGARDAGVAVFIDRQLTSVWGVHGRNYRQGPWIEGT